MNTPVWWSLARRQYGVLARRQLRALGLDDNHVRHQVDARRWAIRSPTVVSVTTGVLTFEQRLWLGVLHAGRGAAVGSLSALAVAGLQGWDRPTITVMVPQSADVTPLPGFRFARTRRRIDILVTSRRGLPLVAVEPAALLYAGYARSDRVAVGLLAATVQQRLTTGPALATWVDVLRPLRHARGLRQVLGEIDLGAQSAAEIDVSRMCRRYGLPLPERQVRRRDSTGRLRYTDCEWVLPDGRVVVLEVDGAFHMDADAWAADIARERGLVATGAVVVRCTASELRRHPERVVADLVRLGVGRAGEASA